MNEAVKTIIELGEKTKKLKDSIIEKTMTEYNKSCDELTDDLINASHIKAGDTIEIIGGYRHKGKKAEVHEVGFMLENEYMHRFVRDRYASACVSLLKKDGSLSKVSAVMQLKYLRKV